MGVGGTVIIYAGIYAIIVACLMIKGKRGEKKEKMKMTERNIFAVLFGIIGAFYEERRIK